MGSPQSAFKNPRISAKERNLIKGALRRVFSRADLRRAVLDEARVPHSDPSRPRVTKWVRCAACSQPCAAYQAAVDHIDPVVPVESTLESMTLDELANRLWCEKNNLQVLDPTCHKSKSKLESKERRLHKQKNKG